MTSLAGTLPELQAAYELMTKYATAHSVSIAVAPYGGFRTQADTAQILQYRQDDYNAAVAVGAVSPSTSLQTFRPIAAYGSSYHDFGAAFDVRIVSRPPGMSDAAVFQLLGSYAPTIGLKWGGSFGDPDHFELNIPLSQAKARYQSVGSTSASSATSANDLFTDDSLFDTPTADDFSGDVGDGTEFLDGGDLSTTTFIPDWLSIALVAGVAWLLTYLAQRKAAA